MTELDTAISQRNAARRALAKARKENTLLRAELDVLRAGDNELREQIAKLGEAIARATAYEQSEMKGAA